MTICSMANKSDMFIFDGKCEAHRPGSPPSIPFQGCWHSATCCSPATCYNGVAVQTWQAPTLTTGWEKKRSAQFKRHIKTNMPTCVAKSLGPFKARVSSSLFRIFFSAAATLGSPEQGDMLRFRIWEHTRTDTSVDNALEKP